MQELKRIENLISSTLLRSRTQENVPFDLKQQTFVQTCLAVNEIKNQKLYKAHGLNIEQYFYNRYGISRAQVTIF